MSIIKSSLAAAVISIGLAASASAMPVGNLGGINAGGAQVDQVRTVCNGWGRCWWVPNYGYGYGWRGGYRRHWRGHW